MYVANSGKTDILNGKFIFLQGSPVLDEIAGIKTGRLSLFVAAIALLVGVAALAIHVQPQLLGPMAPLTFKPAPQQAALTLLGRRLDTIESRLAEDLKSLEVLQDRQAALLTMASQINTLAQEMEVIASRLDSVRHGIDAVSAGTSNPDVNDRLEWLEEHALHILR